MEARKIIITGGATRIGAAIAKKLSGTNKEILIHFNKSKLKAEKLKKELEGNGTKVYLVKGDLSKEKDVNKIVEYAKLKLKYFIQVNLGNEKQKSGVLVKEIDELNILYATHLAMIRAIKGLSKKPGHILIDGNMVPKDLNIPASHVIRGDNKSVSIAAASIIAKISRDKIMVDLGQHFPGYGWETNSGYPTSAHILALETLGITLHHRSSFRPIHNILYQE